MLCKYYVAKILKKMKNEKNYDEKKRKIRKKEEERKKEKKKNEKEIKLKLEKNNKVAPRLFLLHKFLSALMTNPYSNLPTLCNSITKTSLVPQDHPFATCTCSPI
jgi:DNA polymerase elongation subunit (family B)